MAKKEVKTGIMGEKHGQKEVFNAGNQSEQPYPIKALKEVTDKMIMIFREYGIRFEGLELLINIGKAWEEGKGSSVYSLRKNESQGDVTATHLKVTRLRSRGLLDVVGKGRLNCMIYGPTLKGQALLKELSEGL